VDVEKGEVGQGCRLTSALSISDLASEIEVMVGNRFARYLSSISVAVGL
jgi:hypothetical protein